MINSNPESKYNQIYKQIVKLSPDDYYKIIFQNDENYYSDRIKKVGFTNKDLVLDMGCGYGQWAVALASLNKHVIAIDRNDSYLRATQLLANTFDQDNITTSKVTFPPLPFPDNHFDYVWCWSVFQFLPKAEALHEIHRVLKPSGRVLLGAVNGRGRWLYKALNNLVPTRFDWNTSKASFKALWEGHRRDIGNHYTKLSEPQKLAQEFGFKFIAADSDGYIDLSNKLPPKPMFEKTYFGLENNIEFIFEKEAHE